LNVDRPDYVRTPEQLILLEGVPEALARLHQAGFQILVITNQACVGRGLVTPETLNTIHQRLHETIAPAGGHIDAIYHCPHTPEAGCHCRKPAPGLIHQARQDWGFTPAQTWMLGDAERDIQAALAAHCRPALTRTGKGVQTLDHWPHIPAFDNLLAFVEALLSPVPMLGSPIPH
jgi:D-glycero-D-manno-heptose 1,7-bisphosphate phosphatase